MNHSMKRRIFLIGHSNRRITVLRLLSRAKGPFGRGPWTVDAVVVPNDHASAGSQEAA